MWMDGYKKLYLHMYFFNVVQELKNLTRQNAYINVGGFVCSSRKMGWAYWMFSLAIRHGFTMNSRTVECRVVNIHVFQELPLQPKKIGVWCAVSQ
jgi:hypothetical protein